jgi:hypothetical protein
MPKGLTDKHFLGMLTKELSGIMDRKWNLERFIVFTIVILQRGVIHRVHDSHPATVTIGHPLSQHQEAHGMEDGCLDGRQAFDVSARCREHS